MTIEEIEKIAKKEELLKEDVVMYYCPKTYGYTQSCDSNGEIKDYYKTLICEKCWFDAKKNVPDTNVGNKNIRVGTKWRDEEEDITFIITKIDGNDVKYECDDCIGSIPKEYLLTHCECIDDGVSGSNNVNHPTHYQGKHECIDVMRVMFGDEAVKGFCKCNAFKYRFRAGRKEENTAEQDIKKAEWYEDYLFRMEEK